MRALLFRACAAVALSTLCAEGALSAPPPNPVVEMTIANRGKITIELYAQDAPKTVAHFLALIKKRFYDGILVHRVEPNFVVQAGDPQTKSQGVDGPAIGTGGSGKNIPFEGNRHTHEMGTVAMALSAPRSDTGDSQFFINLKPNHFLDGDYCVFGKVTKGMEVVKKIQKGDKIVRVVQVKPPKKRS